jgi:phosphatidate cytidylyltransferase
MEFQNILTQKNLIISRREAAVLGGLIPALVTMGVSLNFSKLGIAMIFMLGISWLFLSRILSSREEQNLFISRIAAGFSVILYPGLFLSWIIPMALLPKPEMSIILYLLIVFLNDSSAWAAGMLFGKGNRGIIPASPNKSIAGFVTGIIASVATGLLGVTFFPDAFISRVFPPPAAGALLGFCTGFAATVGDLGESVLKRSAGVKDSGVLMPGRGGILDSIDSLSLAAPVFYMAFRFLFVG